MTETARRLDQTLAHQQEKLYWQRFLSGYSIRFTRLLYLALTDKSGEFSVLLKDNGLKYFFSSKTYVWANAELPVNPPNGPDRALDAAIVQLEQALELFREDNLRNLKATLSKLSDEERRSLNLESLFGNPY